MSNEPPPYVEYSAERFPGEGVFLNLDEEFLCGCDCTDNCQVIKFITKSLKCV